MIKQSNLLCFLFIVEYPMRQFSVSIIFKKSVWMKWKPFFVVFFNRVLLH